MSSLSAGLTISDEELKEQRLTLLGQLGVLEEGEAPALLNAVAKTDEKEKIPTGVVPSSSPNTEKKMNGTGKADPQIEDAAATDSKRVLPEENLDAPVPPLLQRGERQVYFAESIPGAVAVEGVDNSEIMRRRLSQNTVDTGAATYSARAAVDEEAHLIADEANNGIPVASLVSEGERPVTHAAEEVNQEGQRAEAVRKSNQILTKMFGLVVVLGIIIVVVVIVTVNNPDGKEGSKTVDSTTGNVQETPPPLSTENYVLGLLPEATGRDILVALQEQEMNQDINFTAFTPQQRAYEWVLQDPNIASFTDDRIVQRFALATFYFATNGPTLWRNKENWLNHSVHECHWYGAGPSSPDDSPDLFNLVFINDTSPERLGNIPCKGDVYHFLRLKDNDLEGNIPEELYLLSNLRGLSLEDNSIRGTISSEIGMLQYLEELVVLACELTGSLPTEFGLLTNLQTFHPFINQLTGTIPTEFGLLSNKMSYFSPSINLFTGTLPSELGLMTNTEGFSVHSNSLSGTIPSGMFLRRLC